MKIKFRKIILLSIKLSLLMVSTFIVFLFTELATRVYGTIKGIDFRLYMHELKNSDRLPAGLFIPDDIVHAKLSPNTQVLVTTSDFSVIYKINSKGLRDKEYSYAKPEDKIRILVFGDSFVFGEGVEYGKRFTDIPEDYHSNLEIINFGIPGWGIDQELIYFAAEGLKYSPDYVIIFINRLDTHRYSTNIIKDNSVALKDIISKEPTGDQSTLYLSKGDSFFKTDGKSLMRNFYFLSYFKYQISLVRLRRKLERDDEKVWNDVRKSPETPRKLSEDKEYSKYIQKRAEMIIGKFNEICRENNVKLIIVKIDTSEGLDYLESIDKSILYYDLTEGLKSEKKKHSLSFKYDGHFNPRTHNYIGRRLIEILRSAVN